MSKSLVVGEASPRKTICKKNGMAKAKAAGNCLAKAIAT